MYDVNKYKCYGYDEKNPDGSVRCHCVVAISSYAGKTVKGYAKCHPNDTWNWEKGRDLAIARCAAKIAVKRANRAAMKLAEAQDILDSATVHVADMSNYFNDAIAEVTDARLHLSEVLENM